MSFIPKNYLKLIPRGFILANLFLVHSILLNASVVVPSTVISRDTIWKSDTVKLTTNVTISEKATLLINPGVVVEFQGSYGITVYGALVAEGTIADSIKFQVNPINQNVGWKGIQFIDNSALPSIIRYCVFKYGNGTSGGAVYAKNTKSLTIEHAAFSSNYSQQGGALYFQNSGFVLANCQIFGNNSVNEGGGVYVTNCAKVSILNNLIFENKSTKYGGGIYLESSKTLIKANRVFNNNCTGDVKNIGGGGGIATFLGEDTISNNLIFNNETNTSGGGLLYLSGRGLSLNNDICNNKASDGGGISIINSGINVYNSIFWNNFSTSPLIKSHNLYINSTQISTISNCLVNASANYLVDTEKNSKFLNNINADPSFFISFSEVGMSGKAKEAVWLIQDKSPAIDAGFLHNSLPNADYGGNPRITNAKVDIGAYEYQPELNYGGVYTTDVFWYGKINATKEITIANNARLIIFAGTTVNFTGPFGITIQGQVLANGEFNKPIIFSRTVAKVNKVTDTPDEGWQGLQFFNNTLGALSQLNYCILEYCNNNQAVDRGGAITCYRSTQLTIKNLIVRYCTAPKGGAIYGSNTTNLNIINALFYGNISDAGGVFYLNNAKANILNCTTYNNEAQNGGGLYCVNSSPVIENSIFWKNSAKKGAQIYLSDINSDPGISYSVMDKDIDGIEGPGAGTNYTGTYFLNINKNPLFNNPDKGNQFSLKAQSPCINAGNPKTTSSSIGWSDLVGNNRFVQTIDIGAYEYQSIAMTGSLPDLSLAANTGLYTIDLSKIFTTTAVSDSIYFYISAQSDTNTLSVKIISSQLQIVPKPNTTGIDTIIIIAESTQGALNSDTFLVKVDYLAFTLQSPFNNYHFKLNEDQVMTWSSVPSAIAALRGYCLKIAEIKNGQTPEQALNANAPWYTDTIPQSISSMISTLVKRKYPIYGKMVWQVYAIGMNNAKVGLSPIQTFYGAPLLHMFYAGSNIVNVDTTTNHDISGISGKGNIVVPAKGKISFNFSGLSLKSLNNSYYLDQGVIGLSFADSVTLWSDYKPNGIIKFIIDSLYVDRTGFTVRCKTNWEIPVFQGAKFDLPFIKMNYSRFKPTGTVLLNAATFKIDALPGATIAFDMQSFLSITEDSYTPSLQGVIKAPINKPTEYLNDSIQFAFSGVGTVDYFQSNGSTQQKLALNLCIHIVPVQFTADFSDAVSPAPSMTPEWKGIWCGQFKIAFNDKGVDYPFTLSAGDGIYFNPRLNANAKFELSSSGLEIKVDTTFQLSISSRFNGFAGSLKSIRMTRPLDINTPDMFSGGAVVPFIDEVFEHRYVVNFDGLDYTPAMQPVVPDFSFYPYSEKSIESIQILSGNQRFDGVIDQATRTIHFEIPDNIDIHSVPAYFVIRGNRVIVSTNNQVRGVTLKDFTSPTIYRIYAGNGTYFDYVVTVSKIVTGMREPEISFSVYPNPAKDFIRVSTNNYKASTIRMFDAMGKLMLTQDLHAEDNMVPLQSLAPGIYVLYIQTGEFVQSLRIIKE